MPKGSFQSAHPPTRPPPYCKSQKDDLPPFLVFGWPIKLRAFIAMRDLDPLLDPPPNFSHAIEVKRISDTPEYVGETPKEEWWAKGIIVLTTPPDLWRATLELWRDSTWIEDTIFNDIKITKDDPFDSRLLTHVTIPAIDYRKGRFMA